MYRPQFYPRGGPQVSYRGREPKSGQRKHNQVAEILEIEKEMAKRFYCGSCSLGIDSIEEYREHRIDEEHKFHIERKITSMVPGLGFCQACACMVQTTFAWETHVASIKHSKCIESVNAIDESANFNVPLGCDTPGELGGPIDPFEIDINKTNSYGYNGLNGRITFTNCQGAAIIGLDSVKTIKAGREYKCEVCAEEFSIGHRGTHLSGKKHRIACLKSFYPEWYEKVKEVFRSKVRLKFSILFYASKAEKIEKENESAEAKALRERYFTVDKDLRMQKNDNRGRGERGRPAQLGGYPPRGPPFHGNHGPPRGPPFHGHGPPRGPPFHDHHPRGPPFHDSREPPFHDHPEPRFPSFRGHPGRDPGFDGGHGEKRSYHEPYPVRDPHPADLPSKRFREDRYDDNFSQQENDGEHSKAMDAIAVLEKFALSQAQQEIKQKIASMKEAVLSGGNLTDVEGFGDVVSRVQSGSQSTGPSTVNMGNFSSSRNAIGRPAFPGSRDIAPNSGFSPSGDTWGPRPRGPMQGFGPRNR